MVYEIIIFYKDRLFGSLLFLKTIFFFKYKLKFQIDENHLKLLGYYILNFQNAI